MKIQYTFSILWCAVLFSMVTLATKITSDDLEQSNQSELDGCCGYWERKKDGEFLYANNLNNGKAPSFCGYNGTPTSFHPGVCCLSGFANPTKTKGIWQCIALPSGWNKEKDQYPPNWNTHPKEVCGNLSHSKTKACYENYVVPEAD